MWFSLQILKSTLDTHTPPVKTSPILTSKILGKNLKFYLINQTYFWRENLTSKFEVRGHMRSSLKIFHTTLDTSVSQVRTSHILASKIYWKNLKFNLKNQNYFWSENITSYFKEIGHLRISFKILKPTLDTPSPWVSTSHVLALKIYYNF